ncbi:MAG: DUF3078 domain-containing protein [Paludibacter sp.]|nr:DUF3078 domain-containing protein [Paludibacter sp.]
MKLFLVLILSTVIGVAQAVEPTLGDSIKSDTVKVKSINELLDSLTKDLLSDTLNLNSSGITNMPPPPILNPGKHEDVLDIMAARSIDSLRAKRQETIDVDSIQSSKDAYTIDLSKAIFDLYEKLSETKPKEADSLLLEGNPFFINLVYKKPDSDFNLKKHLLPYTLFVGKSPVRFNDNFAHSGHLMTDEEIIQSLRGQAMKKFALSDPDLFVYRADELPSTDEIKSRKLKGDTNLSVHFVDNDKLKSPVGTIKVEKGHLNPWTKKANVLTQFSQNVVSNNWYQGGNNNMAVLGVLTGQLNYDNKNDIQFENSAEWRMGFYFVDDSTALRTLNVNNDVLKASSKLGYKINGNWYYSGSVDLSTQLLNNYQAVNSDILKATFLTPIRLNVGIGLDYKYKKLFSLALSPIAYKYIYINETDEEKIDPNQFGIEVGQDHLSEIGSSFKAQLMSYAPIRELQINSTFSFYTNYEKVEIDWEVVGNFTINRFLSTRISVNPRYDNTVILQEGEKAHIQFKEFMSFGFSYKLLD